ncbi:cupin domain-containing protein [Desulfobacula sp.]|uniref:cupin domain-containing protein n=1 Tax=Desulfobacula sp. TaxID=2593537 RepID=UPI00263147A5|nr:cupin domain-containing protein [Desulfobacula sp.]
MREEVIAENIRRIRKQNKMTIQALADLTGLTKGYLSKVERSKTAPPFSTVNRIAMAFGVDLTVFFVDREKQSESPRDLRISFDKKNDDKVVKTLDSHHGYKYKSLGHNKAGKNMIPYLIEPAADEKGVFQHEGEEFIYVLEGKHEMIYDGQSYVMEEGDSVYFDAGVPHTGKAIGGKKTLLLAVIYNYKRF